MAEERKWRTLDVLFNEQKKIDEELAAFHQELIDQAKAIGNGDGDAAADIVENLKKYKITDDEYKHWSRQYNNMMRHAREIAAE